MKNPWSAHLTHPGKLDDLKSEELQIRQAKVRSFFPSSLFILVFSNLILLILFLNLIISWQEGWICGFHTKALLHCTLMIKVYFHLSQV